MGHSSDRNMLVGILALQMDFIDQEQLLAAMNAWVMRKTVPLEDILLELRALTPDTAALLQALVAKHVELHGNNAQQSLQAISSMGPLQDELKSLADPDIEATLTIVGRSSISNKADRATLPHQSSTQDPPNRFRVIRPHAKGGLGEVFLARDTELNREVALKEIQERFAKSEDSRSRFMLEAEVTGGLEHPGIVPVYGLGQYADGRPFYAMRFIKGDSLKDAIDRFHTKHRGANNFTSGEVGVEFRQLLGRFIDVCQAIEYAHSRGVLHRDLKPGNIMLGKYGETLVVDWGLAKVVGRTEKHQSSGETTLSPDAGSGSAPTQLGSAIGTPAFMSPEQAAGDHDALGPAADVYSLGATLYCLLTGEAAFHNDEAQNLFWLLEKVKRSEFKRPKEINTNIPQSLEAVCLKAMSNQPKDRYASPVHLADDIEHWLADEPVSCFSEPIGPRVQRWMKKHRTIVTSAIATASVLIVSLAIGFGVLSVEKNKTDMANMMLVQEQLNTEKINAQLQGVNKAEQKARERAEDLLYLSNIQLAAVRIDEGLPHVAKSLLAATPSHLRNYEFKYLSALADPSLISIPQSNRGAWGVAFNSDSSRALLQGLADSIIVDCFDGSELFRLNGLVPQSCLLSNQTYGTKIVTASPDGTFYVWNSVTGEPICKIPRENTIESFYPYGYGSSAISADESLLVIVDGKVARTIDTNTGKVLAVFNPRTTYGIEYIHFKTPTALRIVSFEPENRAKQKDPIVEVWDVVSGTQTEGAIQNKLHIIPGSGIGVCLDPNYDYSGDEQPMFNGCRIVDLVTESVLWKIESPINSLVTSSDNAKLLTADFEGLTIYDLSGGRQLVRHDIPLNKNAKIAFLPDDQHILIVESANSLETTVHLFNYWSRNQRTLLQSANTSDLQVCTDGTRALLKSRGEITLIDLPSGQRKDVPGLRKRQFSYAQLNQDGSRLVTIDRNTSVQLWDLDFRRERQDIAKQNRAPFLFIEGFAKDGKWLIGIESGNTLKILDAVSAKELVGAAFPGKFLSCNSAGTIAAGLDGEGLFLFDIEAQHRLPDLPEVFNASEHGADYAKFSEDSKFLAVYGKNTQIWDLSKRTKIFDLRESFPNRGNNSNVLPWVTWSPDGKMAAIRDALPDNDYPADVVRVVECATGKAVFETKGRHGSFSPNGKFLLTCGYDSISCWDTTKWKLVRNFEDSVKAWNYPLAAFQSNDRIWIATTGDVGGEVPEPALVLLEIQNGNILNSVHGHQAGIDSIQLSHDGKRILTNSRGDGTSRIWDTQSGRELLKFAEKFRSIQLSPDGSSLLAQSTHGYDSFLLGDYGRNRARSSSSVPGNLNAQRLTELDLATLDLNARLNVHDVVLWCKRKLESIKTDSVPIVRIDRTEELQNATQFQVPIELTGPQVADARKKAIALIRLREYQQAKELLDRLVDYSANGSLGDLRSLRLIASLAQGKHPDWEKDHQLAENAISDPSIRAYYTAQIHALNGDFAQARKALVEAQSAHSGPDFHYNYACAWSLLSEIAEFKKLDSPAELREMGLDTLAFAIEVGYFDWDQIANDPDLDSLRVERRFQWLTPFENGQHANEEQHKELRNAVLWMAENKHWEQLKSLTGRGAIIKAVCYEEIRMAGKDRASEHRRALAILVLLNLRLDDIGVAFHPNVSYECRMHLIKILPDCDIKLTDLFALFRQARSLRRMQYLLLAMGEFAGEISDDAARKSFLTELDALLNTIKETTVPSLNPSMLQLWTIGEHFSFSAEGLKSAATRLKKIWGHDTSTVQMQFVPLFLSKYDSIADVEVTNGMYAKFRPESPQAKRDSDLPVVNVTHADAAAFCNWLSQQDGLSEDQWCYRIDTRKLVYEATSDSPGQLDVEVAILKPDARKLAGYRLPSQHEWESQCRNTTVSKQSGALVFSNNSSEEDLLSKDGWFLPDSRAKIHPSGLRLPTSKGIYDLFGNVDEWCEETSQVETSEADEQRLPSHLLMGGSVLATSKTNTIEERRVFANYHGVATGFRVVRGARAKGVP